LSVESTTVHLAIIYKKNNVIMWRMVWVVILYTVFN